MRFTPLLASAMLSIALAGCGSSTAEQNSENNETLPDTNATLPASEPFTLTRAHAHNDYLHEHPLLDALSHGFGSVEADVWRLPLVSDKLYVAHTALEISQENMLRTLYLDPLAERIAENNGSVYAGETTPLQLLIDIKSDAEGTYAILESILNDYRSYLTCVVDGELKQGAVTVVLSGNRPYDTLASQQDRCAFYDGRIDDLDSGDAATLVPLVSDNWGNLFSWDGNGEMPEEEKAQLADYVDRAHAKGRKLRFWSTPDDAGSARTAVWAALYDAGVDYLNTNDLAGLETFLREGSDTNASKTYGTLVSAHRGGAAYAPENTMTAYRNAARLGVDDFETDMVLTSDSVAVLIHDTTLDRTTDCSGDVADKTYAELLECDAAYWWSPGQSTTSVDDTAEHPLRGAEITIPTAEELFAFAAGFSGGYAPTVTIEIKYSITDPFGLQAAKILVPLIQNSGIKERIIVQSFNPEAINSVKLLDSEIKTLYLTSGVAYLNLWFTVLHGHEYVAPSFDTFDLDATFVTSAHDAGKLVVPWTADSAEEVQSMLDIGVDGIISNYPACQLSRLGRLNTTWLSSQEFRHLELSLCKQ